MLKEHKKLSNIWRRLSRVSLQLINTIPYKQNMSKLYEKYQKNTQCNRKIKKA